MDGQPSHTYTEKIGIREISTKDGVFRINGQAVKLRGVNRHDEWPTVGRAVGPQHWLEDLQKMKSANINYVRACHYQHAKGVKTRIQVDGYIDRDKTTSREVSILSKVLGRAEKGRLNDRNYRVLPTDTFRGHLAIWQQ
ncbi:MAG: hypothetical protein IJ200_05470 [Prevotella sp.]|nr:hypothetical protein [Prevotella sp.]